MGCRAEDGLSFLPCHEWALLLVRLGSDDHLVHKF